MLGVTVVVDVTHVVETEVGTTCVEVYDSIDMVDCKTEALPETLGVTLETVADVLAEMLGETLADMLAEMLLEILGEILEMLAGILAETLPEILGEILGDTLDRLPEALAEVLIEAVPEILGEMPEALAETLIEAVPGILLEMLVDTIETLGEILADALGKILADALGETLADMLPEILGARLDRLPEALAETLIEAVPEILLEIIGDTMGEALPDMLADILDERLETLGEILADALGEILADMLAEILGDWLDRPPEALIETLFEAVPEILPETLGDTLADALGETLADIVGETPADMLLEILGDWLETLPETLTEALIDGLTLNVLVVLPAPDPLTLPRLDVADPELVDSCAVDDPPNDIDVLMQSRPVHEVVEIRDPVALAAMPVLDRLEDAALRIDEVVPDVEGTAPDVTEPAAAEVPIVEDPPSGIDALTQSRPVHEVVEDWDDIGPPLIWLVDDALDPGRTEIVVLDKIDVEMIGLPEAGPVLGEVVTLDVTMIELTLSDTLVLAETDGDVEEGNADDVDDTIATDEPSVALLAVDDRDPMPREDTLGVEMADVPLNETDGLEVEGVPLVDMLRLNADPVPNVETVDVKITVGPLTETPGLLDTDAMMEDTTPDDEIDVPLFRTLELLDPMADVTMPEVEVPVVPPMALLTLPVKDPGPKVDVAGVEITDVPLTEIIELPEIVVVLGADTLDVGIMEVSLAETLVLAVVPGIELLGVEITDVPLIGTLRPPERVLVMLEAEKADVTNIDVPPLEIDGEEGGETLGVPDVEVPKEDDKTPDVNEVIERAEL